MALNKTMKADNGIDLSYWKIDSLEFRYRDSSKGTIIVCGYIDRTNRETYDCTMVKYYRVSEGDFATYFDHAVLDAAGNNPIKAAYEWLKTQPDFIDATDILEVNEFAPILEQ